MVKQKKEGRLYVRLSEEEKETWERCANEDGRKLSDFVRKCVNDRVKKMKPKEG